MLVDFNKLSDIAKERLVSIYNRVRTHILSENMQCNNWVKQQLFLDVKNGFPMFVDNLMLSVRDNEIDWYAEDEDIIEWCIHELHIADFLYQK